VFSEMTQVPSSSQTTKSASDRLTVRQTQTGYWTVQRGSVHVAGSMTRRGAEAEREMLVRLGRRSVRRAARPV
jgi:hypothetical protein